MYRNFKRQSTRTSVLMKSLEKMFNVVPKSTSWFANFCRRNHLSLLRTSIAKWAERSPRKFKDAVANLKRVRHVIKKEGIALSQVACVDKTKFYCESKSVKHVGLKGGYGCYNGRGFSVLSICNPSYSLEARHDDFVLREPSRWPFTQRFLRTVLLDPYTSKRAEKFLLWLCARFLLTPM